MCKHSTEQQYYQDGTYQPSEFCFVQSKSNHMHFAEKRSVVFVCLWKSIISYLNKRYTVNILFSLLWKCKMLNKPFITEDVSYKNIKISRKVNVSCKDHNEQAFKTQWKNGSCLLSL